MKNKNGFTVAALAALLSAPVYATDVAFSGQVEVEAGMAEDYDGTTTTDLVLAKAVLLADVAISEPLSAHLALLYEEDGEAFDGTTFGLEEGYVTLQLSDAMALVAGRMFVPFGRFESNMVSDPLTKELGESSETAVVLEMTGGNLGASLYTFNGDADETTSSADNDTLSFGARLGFANDNFSLGASYISNLADSDFLQATTPGTLKSAVAGYGVNFGWRVNNVSLIAEYLAAAEGFSNGDVLTAGDVPVASQEQPSASNLELAFESGNATFAVAYQMTTEAAFLGLPETVASAAVSFAVMEGASIGAEYATMADYAVVDGGGGESASALTLKLVVEF
ncbi:MAG: LbtU family siderophore porin [Gammaproteobacteria bacterium]|nr:LbtU family siderophore porin [Gammaproteobacteria bacterium]